jgi:site-specific DNA recombinase
MGEHEWLTKQFEANRTRLRAVAYRVLGSLSDADDVREAWLAELHFAGVHVVSVADGLDGHDEDATLGIQIRGIFNELQLHDLKKKTLRGQIGQKQRGFSVGDHTYGYTSVPVGATRLDKRPAETGRLQV